MSDEELALAKQLLALFRVVAALIVATPLVLSGWGGWKWTSFSAGSLAFIALAFFNRGYWRPALWRQIYAKLGKTFTIVILPALIAFNVALSAATHGMGVLMGFLFRHLVS